MGMGGGEGPAMVSWWWERWMLEVGWVDLDVREKRDRGGGKGTVRRLEKNEGKGKKCDLKQVTQDLKPSTFERT
jgi:hypothetical protein